MRTRLVVVFVLSFLFSAVQSQELTYAERLGFPKGSKVIILHIDDVDAYPSKVCARYVGSSIIIQPYHHRKRVFLPSHVREMLNITFNKIVVFNTGG